MRSLEKLTELLYEAARAGYSLNEKNDIEDVALFLTANGCLVVDIGAVSDVNRPLITECLCKPLDEVIEAVRKQEPMPPVKRSSEYDGEYGACPSCGKIVTEYGNYKVCECGQKLDWREN